MVDLLGFFGSALIVLSLTMRSIVKLRLVGIVGAMVFIGYGVLLSAWPVVATNCVTFSIHLYRLRSRNSDAKPASEPVDVEPANPVNSRGPASIIDQQFRTPLAIQSPI